MNDQLLIRKFAVGHAADKLRTQADWLTAQAERLPLVSILTTKDKGSASFAYDMPYIATARDFYEVIHTTPVEHSTALLHHVIDHVAKFHEITRKGPVEDSVIQAYLEQKVCANALSTLRACAEYAPWTSVYHLNGKSYSLEEWNLFQDHRWLRNQIRDKESSLLHGDLTIENIIVSSEQSAGFYIIDPNPSNIFDSPLIDWAKLMQSLHLGYEGLNRAPDCSLRDAELSLLLQRSYAYTQLHQTALERLKGMFDRSTIQEIMFHEIVNYLRLTPYKFRQSPAKGMAFFGCVSLLLREYVETYDAWV